MQATVDPLCQVDVKALHGRLHPSKFAEFHVQHTADGNHLKSGA